MKTFKTEKGTELPILNLKGKDYLEVKYRLVWFREEHPDWGINTVIAPEFDKSRCVARAEIRSAQGVLMASGTKVETAAGFPDFIEKAETGAIGRALALCGYGTQFCADELDEGERLADAPVDRNAKNKIVVGQPGPNDGIEPSEYRIPFGQWKNLSLQQVHRDYGLTGKGSMGDYINYLEGPKAKKPISEQAKEFIERASDYIASIENAHTQEQPPLNEPEIIF